MYPFVEFSDFRSVSESSGLNSDCGYDLGRVLRLRDRRLLTYGVRGNVVRALGGWSGTRRVGAALPRSQKVSFADTTFAPGAAHERRTRTPFGFCLRG